MSFGFSVSDFIAVGSLARQLYKDIYLIARDAPEELQLLNSEIGILALSIDLIIQEVKDENSTLVRAGGNRMRTVGEVMKQANGTLKDLEAFAQKHDFSHGSTKGKGRRIWDRIKFSAEVKSVESLRGKISRHIGTMNLLLTSAGNSSLERIENLSNRMQQNIVSLQDMMINPRLSSIEERSYQLTLSQAFMKEAETTRSWLAIGFDEWIRAARWWLLKAQSNLYTDTSTHLVPTQAFTDLLKASFLLIDIFPQHPQRRFWTTEYLDVEILAEALKSEFETIDRMGYVKPDLGLVESSDLRIWVDAPPAVTIRPKSQLVTTSGPRAWLTQSDEIIWKGFGSCTLLVEEMLRADDCMIMILVNHDTKKARIIAQNQGGIDRFTSDISFELLSQLAPEDYPAPVKEEIAILQYSTGFHASLISQSLVFSNYKLAFSNEKDSSDFTAILTAVVLYQELQGVARTISALQGIILLLTIARGNRALITEHLKICRSYYEDHTSLSEEDLRPLPMAICAASQVLNTELTLPYSELDYPYNSVINIHSVFSQSPHTGSITTSLGKSYLVSCWLLAILSKPILLRLDWEVFARGLSIPFPKDVWNVEFLLGIDVLSELSILHRSTMCELILEKCVSIGTRTRCQNKDNIYYKEIFYFDTYISRKCRVYNPSRHSNYEKSESSNCGEPGLLWVAIMADNGPAASYLLKQITPYALPRLEIIQHLIDGQLFSLLRLALVEGSCNTVRNLLKHYRPNAYERVEILNFHLVDVFSCWFYSEAYDGSKLSNIIYNLFSFYHTEALERHKSALVALLEHTPGFENIDLNRALVQALRSYNIPAARILAAFGAKITPEAEDAREIIVTTKDRGFDFHSMTTDFNYKGITKMPIHPKDHADNISDIKWLYGGKCYLKAFKVTRTRTDYMSHSDDVKWAEDLNREMARAGDMSYWDDAKGAEDLNRRIELIDLEKERERKLSGTRERFRPIDYLP